MHCFSNICLVQSYYLENLIWLGCNTVRLSPSIIRDYAKGNASCKLYMQWPPFDAIRIKLTSVSHWKQNLRSAVITAVKLRWNAQSGGKEQKWQLSLISWIGYCWGLERSTRSFPTSSSKYYEMHIKWFLRTFRWCSMLPKLCLWFLVHNETKWLWYCVRKTWMDLAEFVLLLCFAGSAHSVHQSG